MDEKQSIDSKQLQLSAQYIPQTKPIPPVIQKSSQYSTIYNCFFDNMKKVVNLNDKIEVFRKNRVHFNAHKFQSELNITILYKTPDSQIINLAVSFSHFMLEILVFNFNQKTIIQQYLPQIGKGSFGQIFLYKDGLTNKEVVIKSLKYFSKDCGNKMREIIQKSLRNAILEYCVCKIFSCLEIGPYIQNTFGFDIIIYSNAIQFSMEKCQKVNIKDSFETLCASLKLMHTLQLIHGDIKPDNIMWSTKYNKNVFVDFGLAKLLKEKVGMKTLTYFFGTYDWCSDEMKKIVKNSRMSQVDLYYNDLYGLLKVIKQKQYLKQKTKQASSQVVMTNPIKYQILVFNIQLASLIYNQDIDNLRKIIEIPNNMQILEWNIQLLKGLDPSPKIYKTANMLIQRFQFKKEDEEEILGHHKRKILKEFINLKKKKVLDARLHEIENQFTGTLNLVMAFLLQFYKEDITPRALNQKQKLKQKLYTMDIHNEGYWQNLVLYSTNSYTTVKDLSDIFQYLKQQLHIREWVKPKIHNLWFYVKANQIAELVKQRFKINLYEVRSQIQADRAERMYDDSWNSSMTSCPFTFYNECNIPIGIFHLALKSDDQKPIFGLLRQQCSQCDDDYLSLLSKALYVHSCFNKRKAEPKEEVLQSYMETFLNFQTANRCYPLTLMRERRNLKIKNVYNKEDYFYFETKFYRDTVTYCFVFSKNLFINILNEINIEATEDQKFVALANIRELVADRFKNFYFKLRSQAVVALFIIQQISIYFECYDEKGKVKDENKNINEILNQIFQDILEYFTQDDLLHYTDDILKVIHTLPLIQNSRRLEKFKDLFSIFEKGINKGNQNFLFSEFTIVKTNTLKIFKEMSLVQQHKIFKDAINYMKYLQTDIHHSFNNYQIQLLFQYILHEVLIGNNPAYYMRILEKVVFLYPEDVVVDPFIFHVIGVYYGFIRFENDFAQYFEFLRKFVLLSHQMNSGEFNIVLYGNLYLLMQNYLNFTECVEESFDMILEQLQELRKEDVQQFYIVYSNFIIFAEIAVGLYLYRGVRATKQLILSIMKMVCFWKQNCNYYFRRSIETKINIYLFKMIQDQKIHFKGQRKLLQINLRAMRNRQYWTDGQILKILTAQIKVQVNHNPNKNRVNALQKIRYVFQSMKMNKQMQLNWSNCWLKRCFKVSLNEMYLKLINKRSPVPYTSQFMKPNFSNFNNGNITINQL